MLIEIYIIMTAEEKQLLKYLTWAREQLMVFISLEKQINIYLGKYGFENMCFFKPLFLFLVLASSFVNIICMELWSSGNGNLYLLGALAPLITFFYCSYSIKSLKKQNIFKFLGSEKKLPPSLLTIIEMHVFSEQDKITNVINWRAVKKKMPEKDVVKYKRLFDLTSWQNNDKATRHCSYLGVLMFSLQRYLYEHKKFYNKHISTARRNEKVIDSIYNIQNLPGAKKNKTESTASSFDGINTEDFFDNSRSRL